MSTTRLKPRHFKCLKEDNSESENDRQWKQSKIVFDEFHKYLMEKGLKDSTCDNRTDEMIFFFLDYLFVYQDENNMLDVDKNTIRTYLGNWYIRKFWNPSMKGIKSRLKAISDFYVFLHSIEYIDDGQLQEIKYICRNAAWFEMRLKTYFAANDEEFHDWLDHYD